VPAANAAATAPSVERRRDHQKVAGAEELFEVDPTHAECGFPFRVEGLHVGVEDRRASETLQALRDGRAHAARTQDADHAAVEARAVEPRPPAGEALAHRPVPRGHVSSERDEMPDGELGGGLGEQVRHHRDPDAPAGAGGHVEVVEALQRAGNDAQIRAGGKEGLVHAVRHEGHHRPRIGAACQQLLLRPGLTAVVGLHPAVGREDLQHLWMNPIRDYDLWQHSHDPDCDSRPNEPRWGPFKF
jgi:hypothetical protein